MTGRSKRVAPSRRAALEARKEFAVRADFPTLHYRPTLERTPSEANLRRARLQLVDINRRIAVGSFVFAEEFPDYRYMDELEQESEKQKKATCGEVFDRFTAHCSMRVVMNDMAYSTMKGYEKILDAVWRPAIGDDDFEDIVYSRLAAIAAAHTAKKKHTTM